MRNIRIDVEYDGSDFCGWQWQPACRSVQGELQQAVKELLQEDIKIVGAGRTDAGVHALRQVANFKCVSRLDLRSVRLGLNSYLPADIRVQEAAEAREDFHARFTATSRSYRYIISTRMTAIARQYVWFCKYKLDVARIQAACAFLLGSHAFTAFSKSIEDEAHYLCDVKSISWHEEGEKLVFEITANRFLHNMVRIIVGTMVEVGRGKLQPADVNEMLRTGDRHRAGSVAPAHGLVLVGVNYD